jgi:hypothetical protein
MERVLERFAALDLHKAQVTAWVRVPDGRGGREDLRARYSTLAADLLALRDWLGELGVTHVAMESRGVYWKPVYYVLEDDFELLLVNAQHVKNFISGPGVLGSLIPGERRFGLLGDADHFRDRGQSDGPGKIRCHVSRHRRPHAAERIADMATDRRLKRHDRRAMKLTLMTAGSRS